MEIMYSEYTSLDRGRTRKMPRGAKAGSSAGGGAMPMAPPLPARPPGAPTFYSAKTKKFYFRKKK